MNYIVYYCLTFLIVDVFICNKTRVQLFYFNSKTAISSVPLYKCVAFFGKLIFTECCLVTWTVKVISTDLEHGMTPVVTAIYKRLDNTQFVFFFEHRRKSRDRFRMLNLS